MPQAESAPGAPLPVEAVAAAVAAPTTHSGGLPATSNARGPGRQRVSRRNCRRSWSLGGAAVCTWRAPSRACRGGPRGDHGGQLRDELRGDLAGVGEGPLGELTRRGPEALVLRGGHVQSPEGEGAAQSDLCGGHLLGGGSAQTCPLSTNVGPTSAKFAPKSARLG